MFTEPSPDLLRSIKSDEFLPLSVCGQCGGGLFLVVTVGAAITLAAVIKYNITVKASATVRPTGELRIVQAATAGTVKSILVQENQVVKEGDAIAQIDNSQLQTKKSQLQGNIQQGQPQLAQIAAQISALDKERDSESSLINHTIASAQADLSRNQREYQERQITTKTQVQEAQAALELARVELKQYQQLASTGRSLLCKSRKKNKHLLLPLPDWNAPKPHSIPVLHQWR